MNVIKLNRELLDSLSFSELLIYQTAYTQGVIDCYYLTNEGTKDLLSLRDALSIYVLERSKKQSDEEVKKQ